MLVLSYDDSEVDSAVEILSCASTVAEWKSVDSNGCTHWAGCHLRARRINIVHIQHFGHPPAMAVSECLKISRRLGNHAARPLALASAT